MSRVTELNGMKIDVPYTCLHNLVWVMFLALGAYGFFKMIGYAGSLESPLQPMFLIFTIYMVINFLRFVGHPELVYKNEKGTRRVLW